jgi:hypothetical protein
MPPRRLEPLRAALLVGILAGAVGIGFVWGRQAKSQPVMVVEHAAERACLAPSVAAIAPIADVGALRREIRDVLRQELRQFVAEGPHSDQPAAASVITRAQSDAHERALALLETASAQRRWSNEDAQALRQLMPEMTDEYRQDVLHRLVPALNSGKIASDARLPF